MGTAYARLTHLLLTMQRLPSPPGSKESSSWVSGAVELLLNPSEAAQSYKTCSGGSTLSALPNVVTTFAATRQWTRGQCDQELGWVVNHFITI